MGSMGKGMSDLVLREDDDENTIILVQFHFKNNNFNFMRTVDYTAVDLDDLEKYVQVNLGWINGAKWATENQDQFKILFCDGDYIIWDTPTLRMWLEQNSNDDYNNTRLIVKLKTDDEKLDQLFNHSNSWS